LRLRATSTSTQGFDVRSVADTSWGEGTITYVNAPAVGPVVASSGHFRAAQWIKIDVTPFVTGEGPVSFALTTSRGTELSVASKEWDPYVAPRLDIETTPDPVIAAAGDIACDPSSPVFNGGFGGPNSCGQLRTSDLLVGADLAAVLALGDNQYHCGAPSEWPQSYDPTWGRVKSLTHPVPGNHEYENATGCDPAATGYFDYFNGPGNLVGPAGDRNKGGYYSFDVGSWHIIALNSECTKPVPSGCGPDSAQGMWLSADLAAHPARCVLAYWHYPLFSSGEVELPTTVRPLFQALWDYHADVVLVGHDHNYERFAPQDADGVLQPARGVRQFIVGTGGASHFSQSAPAPNSEVRNDTTFGVLKLTLHPSSYDWRFVPEAGETFTDSGSQPCDAAAPDTTAPSPPANLAANPLASNQVDLSWSEATDDSGVVGYNIYGDGALLATGPPATIFSDRSVAPSSTYAYEVKARDAAGNLSAASNSVLVTTPSAGTVAYQTEADARVVEAFPTFNWGTNPLAVVGGSASDVETYLRFTVPAVLGPVRTARLRLYATSVTVDGPGVFSTDSVWSETDINWSNRPPRASVATDDKSAIASDTWVEWDVTPLVTGVGSYGFALASTSADGVDFVNREAGVGIAELIVTSGQ
jgi:hypothetical protein